MPRPNDRRGGEVESGPGADRNAETTESGAGAESGDGGRREADERPEPTGGQSGRRTDPEPTDSGPDRDPRDDSVQIADEQRRRNTAIISGIVATLGVWVAVSVPLFGATGEAAWNDLLVGAVVFVAAGYNYYRQYNDIPLSVGIASLVAALGLWLIASAGLFEMTGGFFWSTGVSGLLIAAMAGYNAYEGREAQAVTTDRDVAG